MTGAYLRVKREGKWTNIEVEYLTNFEREKILKYDTKLISWLNLLCNKLVEVERLLLDLKRDGIIEKQMK